MTQSISLRPPGNSVFSEQEAFVHAQGLAGSSTPSKLSGACPHPHDSHSGWLLGGELPACSEQEVILEEKLIWQSPARSSFSLPAQVGEGSQAQADLSNRSLVLPPSQNFLPGFKPGEVKVSLTGK